MFSITVTEKGGETVVHDFDKDEISIGRIQGNDIVLPKSNISKRHARIVHSDGTFVVIDSKSTNGTYINGKRIDAPYELHAGDRIFVGDFTMEIRSEGAKKAAPPPPPEEEAAEEAPAEAAAAGAGGERSDILPDDAWNSDASLKDQWSDDWANEEGDKGAPQQESVEDPLDGLTAGRAAPHVPPPEPPPPEAEPEPEPEAEPEPQAEAAPEAQAEVMTEAPAEAETAAAPRPAPRAAAPRAPARESEPAMAAPRPVPKAAPAAPPAAAGALAALVARLNANVDLVALRTASVDASDFAARVRQAITDAANALSVGELAGEDAESVAASAIAQAIDLSPIQDLLGDDSVTEVLVNGARHVYAERAGKLETAAGAFANDDVLRLALSVLLGGVGRRLDYTCPLAEAHLADGARVTAAIAPVSLVGPVLSIRKPAREPLLIDDLVAFGTLTAEMADFLETCVRARKNILVCGETGAGRTTTLNVLASFIPAGERIVTLEEIGELKLEQEGAIRLEVPPPTAAEARVSVRDLLCQALRLRPGRLIVGDCSGPEALELVQAMAAARDGTTVTVFATGPVDALARLEALVRLGGAGMPAQAARELVAQAVDIIVHQARLHDGSRRIVRISEITGMEGDAVVMQDIFAFERKGTDAAGKVSGSFAPTGIVPQFYQELSELGWQADTAIFHKG